MEKIEWNSSFSVGIELLDEQHRQIVNMINRLIADREATVRSESISELLDGLTKFATSHLQTEEQFLEEYAYPDRARGASQVHARLVGKPHPEHGHAISPLSRGTWCQVGLANHGMQQSGPRRR